MKGSVTMIFTRGSLPGILLWVLFIFAPATGYGASLVDTLGDTGATHSFSARLFSDGPGASYFNPTLLLDQRKSFAAGMLYLNQSLSITLGQKNSQYNVPESIFDSMPVDPNTPAYRPLPTDLLRNPRGSHNPSTFLRYLTLGSVLSFAKGNVAFGFTAIMPLKAFQTQRPFYVDEREQYFSNSLHFELFEDRLESNVITFALAGNLTPRIWPGARLTLNQTATSSSEIYMPDASEQEVSFLNSNVEVITTLIPHFAATLLLGEGGRLTATAHMPGESRTEGYSDIQFYNYHNQTGDEATIQKFTLVASPRGFRGNLVRRSGTSPSAGRCCGPSGQITWTDTVRRP